MADIRTGGEQTVVVCFPLEGFERDYTREELLSCSKNADKIF